MKYSINRICRLPRVLAAVIIAIGSLTDASAQTSARGDIDELYELTWWRGPFEVVRESGGLAVIDPSTREQLVAATLTPKGDIELEGYIGLVAIDDDELTRQAIADIEYFNNRSAWGTLELDDLTGELTLRRSIEAGSMTKREIACAIISHGDIVHEERVKFRAAQEAAGRYCAITCRPQTAAHVTK